jgi:hypothetical protein
MTPLGRNIVFPARGGKTSYKDTIAKASSARPLEALIQLKALNRKSTRTPIKDRTRGHQRFNNQ